ncbi:MAG: spore cortex-lytic enzyme [Eubacteriaceae bacterium]|nr:spore cortex-lytic enzyme [Eubacteriaceae bacterium]
MKIKRFIKLYGALALALVLSLGLSSPVNGEVYYYGSTNTQMIKQIQTKLKNWGYYSGGVDGIFGWKTEEAVKYFQRKNSLNTDGKVGPKTLAALGINATSSGGGSTGNTNSGSSGGVSSSDINLLARVVYGEARGEPYEGQVAVAAVILNRVDSSSFPNSVAGIVYQPGAFDAVADGQVNLSPNSAAYRAARDAAGGWDPSGGAIYYYNPATATNKWIRSRPIVARIGNHVFCK